MKRSKNLALIVGLLSLTIAILFMLARPQEARVSSMLDDIQAESVADPPTPPPSTTTPPPPDNSPTPVGKAYLPALIDVASTATATISPDATPTDFLTFTPPPAGTDPPTPPPGSTATPTPTASATISPDATATPHVTITPPAP